MARAAALGRGVSDALEVAVRDEYAQWKLYNAVVALKEFIAALDHTKFDVFIGTPDALKRLQDARYMADAVVLMAEVPNAPPLLAAAPDLLAALKVCIDHDEARFMPGYAYAKEVIAKAEGR